MIEIDANKAIELLEKVVENNPDNVYRQPDDYSFCSYIVPDENGKPIAAGCGVGVALHIAGVSLDTLKDFDIKVGSAINFSKDTVQQLGLKVTNQAAKIFAEFQSAQDLGTPWGQALEHAKERAND